MPDFTVMKLHWRCSRHHLQSEPEIRKVRNNRKREESVVLATTKSTVRLSTIGFVVVQFIHQQSKRGWFALNPYDACVANRIVNGKQCTIVWYVDDGKISHVNHEIVSDTIQIIEKRFGKTMVTRGR